MCGTQEQGQLQGLGVCVAALDFPGGSDGKDSACNAGDMRSVPGLGRFPGEGNGYPLHCYCLENSMDKGVWRATVHEVKELNITERLTLSLSQVPMLSRAHVWFSVLKFLNRRPHFIFTGSDKL